jgi:type VII secretion-associated serine protease mycosin
MSDWGVPRQVWPLSEGAGVTVGVVDTGVQASLPDLRGVVLKGADELGFRGNGDIDWVRGEDGHGTMVAGLIAGQGIGTDGEVGIAPKAKILPVHVLGPVTDVTPDIIAAGIKYAVDHGAGVINISVGGPVMSATTCDPAEQEALAYALSRNVVVVAGAGDKNLTGSSPNEPATCAGVLAVGGIEPSLALWPDSTRGSNVSVAAPGDHVMVEGIDGRSTTEGSGTSFSSPLVAGAAALIRSRYPSMPWYQVDQRIIDTALHVNGLSVPNDEYGYGIMDVAKAVSASAFPVPASAPDPPYTRYLSWLKSADGRSWAKASGVTVPGSSSPAGGHAAASSAAVKPASSSSGTLVIIAVVVVIVIVALVLMLVLRSRKRSRPGPHSPSGWQRQ